MKYAYSIDGEYHVGAYNSPEAAAEAGFKAHPSEREIYVAEIEYEPCGAYTRKGCAEKQTYDEWKSEGRHVKKGERHISRNEDGVPVFYRSQTKETVTYSSSWRGGSDLHGTEDYCDFDGITAYDMGADF